MNERKNFFIDPAVMAAAKKLYKNGAFMFASDSAFIRDVFNELTNKVKKAAAK